jgi:hypothetical protein
MLPSNAAVLAGHVAALASDMPSLDRGLGGQISTIASYVQIGAMLANLLIVKHNLLTAEREEQRRTLNKIEVSIKDHELRLNSAKIKLYQELEVIAAQGVTADNLAEIKARIGSLAVRLERLEQIELELEKKKVQMRGGKITGFATRLWLRKELQQLEEYEEKVQLEKEHILTIMRDIDKQLLHWHERARHPKAAAIIKELTKILQEILGIEIKEGKIIKQEEKFEE